MTVLQRRLVFWGVPGLLLAVALVLSFRPQPVPVDYAQASRGPLVVTVDEEGETRVRDVFVLSAPVTGRARRIEAEVGDRVVGSETVLAFIEPIDPELLDARSENEARAEEQAAEAALTLARAELAKAEADFAFARSELRRQQGLQERGAVSQRDLDDAERSFGTNRAAVDTARAAVQRSSFDLDRARARLVSPADAIADVSDEVGPYISVRSPVSGAVLQVIRESAAWSRRVMT